jgi:uncharacterized protein
MQDNPAFWDTSAIVPLCCFQEFTFAARSTRRQYDLSVVWWGTPVEIYSSIDRLNREGALTAEERHKAMLDWEKLSARAGRIMPDDNVLRLAISMPVIYNVRSADAFQLAAALVWCDEKPQTRPFVCADKRLGEAAGKAGFDVISWM